MVRPCRSVRTGLRQGKTFIQGFTNPHLPALIKRKTVSAPSSRLPTWLCVSACVSFDISFVRCSLHVSLSLISFSLSQAQQTSAPSFLATSHRPLSWLATRWAAPLRATPSPARTRDSVSLRFRETCLSECCRCVGWGWGGRGRMR